MHTFLRRFAAVVAGVLHGFDRLVFKGRLPQLYSPEGMNCYASANHVRYLDFKKHAKEITGKVLGASLIQSALADGRFQYLGTSKESKEEAARSIEKKRPVGEGLVAVLRCVEPAWTFDTKSLDGRLSIVGELGKCSSLYHYYRHRRFGWMYIRLQTWFPFEVQIGLNGREWLAHQMDRAGLKYHRSDNKFTWVENWERAQQLLNTQMRTNWVKEFDALVRQVHPLHPNHLGRLPLAYNWTVHQSEFATDVAFKSRPEVEEWYDRWVRHSFLNYSSVNVLRYLGRSRLGTAPEIQTDVEAFEESVRLKYWVNGNSLKMYDHANILRVETTINNPKEFRAFRAPVGEPSRPKEWRVLERGVAGMHRRAEVSQKANERLFDNLASVTATETLEELVAPWCVRVTEPGASGRKLRALNPLSAEDLKLLTAISDPRWLLNGLRNRDLAEALHGPLSDDPTERKRRSSQISRQLRLLRAHGILKKVPKTHRYQVCSKARDTIVALLAARRANPKELLEKAA
jgi:hypothetical protein